MSSNSSYEKRCIILHAEGRRCDLDYLYQKHIAMPRYFKNCFPKDYYLSLRNRQWTILLYESQLIIGKIIFCSTMPLNVFRWVVGILLRPKGWRKWIWLQRNWINSYNKLSLKWKTNLWLLDRDPFFWFARLKVYIPQSRENACFTHSSI